MEAEDDAERLLRRTEKRAFAAFKISFHISKTDMLLYLDSCLQGIDIFKLSLFLFWYSILSLFSTGTFGVPLSVPILVNFNNTLNELGYFGSIIVKMDQNGYHYPK